MRKLLLVFLLLQIGLFAQLSNTNIWMMRGDTKTLSFNYNGNILNDSLIFVVKSSKEITAVRLISKTTYDNQINILFGVSSFVYVRLDAGDTDDLTLAKYYYDITRIHNGDSTTIFIGELNLQPDIGTPFDGTDVTGRVTTVSLANGTLNRELVWWNDSLNYWAPSGITFSSGGSVGDADSLGGVPASEYLVKSDSTNQRTFSDAKYPSIDSIQTWAETEALVGAMIRDSSQYIYVNSFGAIGDGVTISTDAIIAAINYAKAGNIIYFPDSCYIVDARINILKDGVTLKGNSTTIRMDASASDYILTVGYDKVVSDIMIEGFTFDSNAPNRDSTQHSAIWLLNAVNTEIRNCKFINMMMGDIIMLNAIYDTLSVRVEGCTFDGGGKYLAHNYMFIGTEAGTVDIDNCYFYNIGDSTSDVNSGGNQAIYSYSVDKVNVTNSYFFNCGNGVDIRVGTKYATITNNYFYGGRNGSNSNYAGMVVLEGDDNIVANNHFINWRGTAAPVWVRSRILGGGSNDNIITGNIIRAGLVYSNAAVGILINGARNKIIGNSIRGNKTGNDAGIVFGTYAHDNYADGNTIDSARTGIIITNVLSPLLEKPAVILGDNTFLNVQDEYADDIYTPLLISDSLLSNNLTKNEITSQQIYTPQVSLSSTFGIILKDSLGVAYKIALMMSDHSLVADSSGLYSDELIENPTMDVNITGVGIGNTDETATATYNDSTAITGTGDVRIYCSVAGTDVSRPNISFQMTKNTVIGKKYRIEFKTRVNSGTAIIHSFDLALGLGIILGELTLSGSETHNYDVICTTVGDRMAFYFDGTNTFDIDIDDFSIKEILY